MISVIWTVLAILIGAFILFKIFVVVKTFESLLIKFIETNQEFYKQQKHLLVKAQENASHLKKLQSLAANLRRSVSKFEILISKDKK